MSHFVWAFVFVATFAGNSARAGVCDWVDTSGSNKPGSCWAHSAFNELSTTQKDCEEARNSNLYKRYGCVPPETGGTQSGCSSSQDCFGASAVAQGTGLSGIDSLLGNLRGDASRLRDYQSHRLDSAASTLDNWQAKLGSPESRKQGDITGLNHDRALVSRAMDNFAGKGSFSAEDAAKANDPGIRSDLQNYAYYKSGENAFNSEITQREDDSRKLRAMLDKTKGREAGLDSLKDGGSAARDERDLASSSYGAAAGRASGASREGGTKDSAEDAGPGSDAVAGPGQRPGSLRDRLKEILADRRREDAKSAAAAEALAGASFQKDLKPQSAREDGEGERADLMKEVLGSSAPFSMNGVDTDREVKRLLADGDAASLRSAGVLASESADLFQRVRNAHKSCMQKECVHWK